MSAAAQRRHGFRVEELLPPSVADPKLSTLMKLAQALDVKVCQLVHEEEG
jgi:hypothetical protein